MSYDVDLVGPATTVPCICDCGHEHTRENREEVFSTNYTSNTSGMWYEAGINLRDYDEKPAATLIDPLGLAVSRMEVDPDKYRKFEPNNGWGNYEGTLRFLKSILQACVENPDHTLRVSS